MSYWYPSFNGGVLVCTAHTSNVPTCTYIHTGLYIYEHTYTIIHRGNWYSDCLMATYSWAPCTRLTDPRVHIHVHAYYTHARKHIRTRIRIGYWYSDRLIAQYARAPCTRLIRPCVHIHIRAYLYIHMHTKTYTHSNT